MWLFPEFMRLLRPIILERAVPGTRVLTSTWDLGTWQPDEVDHVDIDGTPIYMWIVPARVAGAWDWELSVASRPFRYSSFVEQHFQKVEGVVRTGDRREVLEGVALRGADITFSLNITLDQLGLTRHEFSGKVVKTTTFGAFVELAKGTDGLLHISNVSPGNRVGTVEEVLNKGDEIAVRVVEVDRERGRIGLRLAEDPDIVGKSVEELATVGSGGGGGGGGDRGGRGRDRDRNGRGGDRGGRGRDRDRGPRPPRGDRDPDRS